MGQGHQLKLDGEGGMRRGGERKVTLGSRKRGLSKKDGHLSGASEWLELGLRILRP